MARRNAEVDIGGKWLEVGENLGWRANEPRAKRACLSLAPTVSGLSPDPLGPNPARPTPAAGLTARGGYAKAHTTSPPAGEGPRLTISQCAGLTVTGRRGSSRSPPGPVLPGETAGAPQ